MIDYLQDMKYRFFDWLEAWCTGPFSSDDELERFGGALMKAVDRKLAEEMGELK